VNTLDLSAVEIRGGPLNLVSDAEIDGLEERLQCTFPQGYREFMTHLGEGTISNFVRVLPPWRILEYLDEHRGLMGGYWSWESPEVPFGQEDAMASIPLAETLQGDVLVFHPSNPQAIYVLPRHEERLHVLGPGLLEAIAWASTPGRLGDVAPAMYFEPQSKQWSP